MSAQLPIAAASLPSSSRGDRIARYLNRALYAYAPANHALGSGAQPRWLPPLAVYGPHWVLPYLPWFLRVQTTVLPRAARLRARAAAGEQDHLGLSRQLYGGRLPTSPLAARVRSDAGFAEARLAGPNPMLIEGLSRAKARGLFPDVAALRQPGGACYLVDFRVLREQRDAHAPATDKWLPCPRLLLRTGAPDGELEALAIQTEAGAPSVLPGDGARWTMAKRCVQVADINHQVLYEHLGHCHGVLGAFALATPRCLPRAHPLRRLLTPHLDGTVMVNWITLQSFADPQGFFARQYAGSLEQSRATVAAAVRGCDLQQLHPEADLRRRRMDKAPLAYAWRDDVRLWWPVLQRFVAAVVAQAYPAADGPARDPALRAWLHELAHPDQGGLQGLPDAEAPSREALVDLLTLVLFLAGPQHATQHYPQTPYYTDPDLFPAALYAPVPEGEVPPDWFARAHPPLEAAISQFHSNHLGNHRAQRFGDYRFCALGRDPALAKARRCLRQDLAAIEAEIDARNRQRRLPYPWLRPCEVPNSTHI